MLESIIAGAAAALGMAALCVVCYRKGAKDGKKAVCKQEEAETAEEQQNALMKKYEAIMGYDPYGD